MYFNSCLAYNYAKNAWNLVEYPILVFAKSVMMIYTQDFLFYTFSLTRFQNLCQWMNWTGAHFETGSSECPLSSGLDIASYSFLLAAGCSYPQCQKIEKVRANTPDSGKGDLRPFTCWLILCWSTVGRVLAAQCDSCIRRAAASRSMILQRKRSFPVSV